MKIPEDPNDVQKRLKGQLAGSRGSSFLEITPPSPQHSESFKKLLGKTTVIKKALKPKEKKTIRKKKK